MADKVGKLTMTFYEQDQGSKMMQHRIEVTCQNPACGRKVQLAVWMNQSSDTLHSLICDGCGKMLYTIPEPDDENGGK